MIVININNIGAKVRATPLTGLSVASGGVIVDTDTVLAAFGKLQHQITNIPQTNPGGSDRQLQFNNAGVFGADTNLVYHATGNLSIGNSVDSGFRLDVTGPSVFRGLSDAASGSALTARGLANLDLFRVNNDGSIFIASEGRTGNNQGSLRINSDSAHNNSSIIIGAQGGLAKSNANSSVTIGPLAETRLTGGLHGGVSVGHRAINAGGISLGRDSLGYRASDFVAGSSGRRIGDVYFGSGIERNGSNEGAGESYTINGSGAFGTNQAGGNLTLAGGKPTGSGTAGDVIFATSTAGASGTTLRNLTDRWAIKGDTGHLQALGAFNILLDTTTGSKIGGAGAKLALYNNTPIAQPTTAIAAATLVGGGGTNITDTDTFDGYTLQQVVKALRDLGALT